MVLQILVRYCYRLRSKGERMMKKVKKTLFASLGMIAVLNISGCGSSSSNTTDQTETTQVETIADNAIPVIPVETPPVDNTPKYTPAGWYMKTSVSAKDPSTSTVYAHKTAGIFGELKESSDDKDRHDIPGYGSAILQVVFVQTTWGSDNGDYFSDYRANSDDTRKVWTFQVKNEKDVHLENADITIMLEGVYDVSSLEEEGRIRYKETLSSDNSKKDAIKLVDVDNQQAYSYEDLQHIQLNMDGKNIRTFRWVLGDVESEDYAPLNPVASKRATTISKTVSQNPSTGFVFEEKPSVEEVFNPSQR